MAKGSKLNFSGTITHYNAIMDDLLKKNFSNVYFLCGSEPFFIDKICNHISENVLEESQKSFNQFMLFGSDVNGTEISEVCRQYPMSSDRSVVIVREGQSAKALDALTSYVANPLESTILVICYSGTLNKTTKFYKAIAKNGIYFESVEPRDYEIQSWLVNHIRSKGYTIDSVSVSMLIESLGTSIVKIDNELKKLISSLKSGIKAINSSDIEANIGISKEYNNFELNRAFSENNIVKALQIADYFSCNPQKNSFQATSIALFTHFIRIFRLGLIHWQSKTQKTAFPSDFELAAKLQIGSTYFLKEYQQAIRHYPLKKLFVIFGILREYEMKGKGVNTGSADSGAILKELICKIFAL